MSFSDAVEGPLSNGKPFTGTNFDMFSAWPSNLVNASATSKIDIGSLPDIFPVPFNLNDPVMPGAVQNVLPTVNNYVPAYEWKPDLSFLSETRLRYEILITNKDDESEDNLVTVPNGKTAIRKSRAMGLATWNFVRCITEKMPESPSEVITANQCLADYTIRGPVISEMGQHEYYREKNFGRKENRFYNCGFWGRVALTNIWGDRIRPGTKLFLILKKQAAPESFYVNIKGTPVFTKTFVKRLGGAVGETVTPIPFQFIPWADYELDEPRESDLVYYDEFGGKHLGIAIHVADLHDYGNGRVDTGGSRTRFHPYRDERPMLNGSLPIYWVQWRCQI
jgi:hypothetical protein